MLALLLMLQAVPATTAGVNSPIAVPVQGATNGKPVTVDASGSTITVNSPLPITGDVSDGTANSGKPVWVGCLYQSAIPVFTTGQRVSCQVDVRGGLYTVIKSSGNSTTTAVVSSPSDTLANTTSSLAVLSLNHYYDPASNQFKMARGDVTGPWVGGHSTIATGQVSCSTTATLIAAARTGRQKLIFNSTAATAFYYGASGVTTTTGVYVAASAGASTSLDTAAAVYCIVPTGTLTLSYAELY